MTGIVIDSFGKEIFVFADGRLTSDDEIFTESYSKIVKLDDNSIVTFCGDVPAFEIVLDHIQNDTDTHENLAKVQHDATIIWISDKKIVEYDFNSKDNNGIITYEYSVSTYTLEVLPIFYGTGIRGLTAAYYALSPRITGKKQSYLENIERVFSAASKRVNSMGELYLYESIKRGKR